MPRLVSWTVGCLAAALQITAADAQGNIDAGKTPAQIFGDTCSACHRSARDLRRASASFLRAHYTTGSEEAASMANYLAGLAAAQPNPSQPKRPPAEAAKQQPPRATAENGRPGPGPGPAPAQPKSRPSASASAQARAVAEERQPELPQPTPPAPVLVPFEE